MPRSEQMNKAFQIILHRLIETGSAPTYMELSAQLGVAPAKGRRVMRKMINGIGFFGWFQSNSDEIESFAPFNNVPTNYRLTVDGQQKWYGQ